MFLGYLQYLTIFLRKGGIISLKGFGQSIVIINSYDIAVNLLEGRSIKYSDRPTSVMLNEL